MRSNCSGTSRTKQANNCMQYIRIKFSVSEYCNQFIGYQKVSVFLQKKPQRINQSRKIFRKTEVYRYTTVLDSSEYPSAPLVLQMPFLLLEECVFNSQPSSHPLKPSNTCTPQQDFNSYIFNNEITKSLWEALFSPLVIIM